MGTASVGVGVAVFVWKDSKFLIGKRIGNHGENTWSIPGGHLEFNESWEEAAKREVKEETGLDISTINLVAVTNDIFESAGKHYITIWVEADWVHGEPRITEPDKYIAQEWCDFQTLPEPLFEPCWQNLQKERPDIFSPKS